MAGRVYDKDGAPEDKACFWPNIVGAVAGVASSVTAWKLGLPAPLAGGIGIVVEDFVAHVICIMNDYGPGYGVSLWRLPSKGRYVAHVLVGGLILALMTVAGFNR